MCCCCFRADSFSKNFIPFYVESTFLVWPGANPLRFLHLKTNLQLCPKANNQLITNYKRVSYLQRISTIHCLIYLQYFPFLLNWQLRHFLIHCTTPVGVKSVIGLALSKTNPTKVFEVRKLLGEFNFVNKNLFDLLKWQLSMIYVSRPWYGFTPSSIHVYFLYTCCPK